MRTVVTLCLLCLFSGFLAAQGMEELNRMPPLERAIRLIMRFDYDK